MNFEGEPGLLYAVTPTEFWSLMGNTFGNIPEAHRLAIYERAVTLIAGRNALYLRLPGENEAELLFRFTQDSVADDWLQSYRRWWAKQPLERVARKFPKMLDMSVARTLLPPACHIFESTRDNRIRVFMSRPGRTCSGANLSEHSMSQALEFCVRWAWQYHCRITQQPCPFVGLL